MEVTVTANLVHLCPHVDELDLGECSLVFIDDAPELHALRRCLDEFRTQRVTHEEVTRSLAGLYPTAVSVTTRWRTAGMVVECSISQE
jgi:hypothetical protein